MVDNYFMYSGKEVVIHISQPILKLWYEKRQTKNHDKEHFGVLIGACQSNFKDYWIESVTIPYRKDNSSRNSFHLKDITHQKVVNQAFNSSNGELIYLGTWHTHPENYPSPSTIDIDGWHLCIKRNPGRQLFFVIVGILEICFYFHHNDEFIKMSQKNYDDY